MSIYKESCKFKSFENYCGKPYKEKYTIIEIISTITIIPKITAAIFNPCIIFFLFSSVKIFFTKFDLLESSLDATVQQNL